MLCGVGVFREVFQISAAPTSFQLADARGVMHLALRRETYLLGVVQRAQTFLRAEIAAEKDKVRLLRLLL